MAERTQRLHRCAGSFLDAVADAAAGGVDDLAVECLSGAEAGETVLELDETIARLQGLRLAVLGRADRADVAACVTGPAAVDTAGWLAHAGLVSGRRARHQVRMAAELTRTYPATASALLAGDLDLEQATVIHDALRQLPDWVSSDDRVKAEKHLLEEALRFDAVRLRRIARHLLEVVDPEGAEAALARRVQADEDRARAAVRLEMRDDGQGVTRGWFAMPTARAAMLRKALDTIASPHAPDPVQRRDVRTDPATGADTTLTRHTAEVLGEALCRLVERLDPAALPRSSGLNASVIVTMSLESLLGGLAPATLDTGDPVSAGEARRLACQAGVVPAVLGTGSEVLDLGRKARLFSRAQRTAMAVRQDFTCAAEACDRPTAWADAHHLDGWAGGGATDLDAGVLICARHHTLAHHPDYRLERRPGHRVRISRQPVPPRRT